MVSLVPRHITFWHRGADADYAPSVFALNPQELILLGELGRNPSDLFRASASKSALCVCLHGFPSFQMVDLARFERATSTFAESRSHSAELQVRNFPEVSELR